MTRQIRTSRHQCENQKGTWFRKLCWFDRWYIVSFGFCTNSEWRGILYKKVEYAIKGLVICDDAERITWIEVGWLGSVHDNQVWSNSEIYMGRDKYLLGDSAFSTSAVMIPAFKKGHNSNLQAKVCIKSTA